MSTSDLIEAAVRPIAEAVDQQIAHLTERVAEENAARMANHQGAEYERRRRERAEEDLAACKTERTKIEGDLAQAASALAAEQTSARRVVGTWENTTPRASTPARPLTTGTLVLDKPGVYEGIRHRGNVIFRLKTGITLRDFDIQLTATTSNGILFEDHGSYGHRLEHGHIWCAPEDAHLCNGIRGRGFTAEYVGIRGVGDGAQLYTGRTSTGLTAIELLSCYIGGLIPVPDPDQDDEVSHNDCLQIQGRIGGRIRHCTLEGGRTSAILATTDVGTEYTHLEITDNVVIPHPTEGAGINIAANAAIPGLLVARNRIGRRAGGKELRASAANIATGSWVDNTYLDDGTLVPVANG